MKKIVNFVMICALGICMAGCMSTRAYLIDRGRDARDMVNVGVEVGAVGVSAQVGPLMTGMIFSDPEPSGRKYNGWGLLDRGVGKYGYGDWQALIIGYKGGTTEGERANPSSTGQMFLLANGMEFMEVPSDQRHWYALGKVEARIALGFGLHVGIHIGEIVDFIEGWFGPDFMHDDIEERNLLKMPAKKKKNETHEKKDSAIAPPAESEASGR